MVICPVFFNHIAISLRYYWISPLVHVLLGIFVEGTCAPVSLWQLSLSMSWRQTDIFSCRYSPPDVLLCSQLLAHICVCMQVCVFMRVCVCVCVRGRMSADICFCVRNLWVSMRVGASVRDCMNAQAQISLVKVLLAPCYPLFSNRVKTSWIYNNTWCLTLQVHDCKKSHCVWISVQLPVAAVRCHDGRINCGVKLWPHGSSLDCSILDFSI